MMRFRSVSSLLVLFALVLSACGSPQATANVVGTPVAVTEVAVATVAPVENTAAVPTEAAVVEASPTAVVDPTQSTGGLKATSGPAVAINPVGTPVMANMATFTLVPGESRAEYQVGETFFNQGNRFNLAIGVTTAVNGQIKVDPTIPSTAQISEITIDISQLTSDSNMRDGRIRRSWLESSTYPIARFVPTKIEGLPDSYAPGEDITFTVTGDLTVKLVTLPVTFNVTARLQDSALIGMAETTVKLSDFGVGPIEIAGILGTEDEAKLVLNFVARA